MAQPQQEKDLITRIKEHLKLFKSQHSTQIMQIERLSERETAMIKGGCATDNTDEDFRRNWVKLSLSQKLNRLMQYSQRLVVQHELCTKEEEQLRALFFSLSNGNVLEEKDTIEYDSHEGCILSIKGLMRDDAGDFFLASEHPTLPKGTKLPAARANPMSAKTLQMAIRDGLANNERMLPTSPASSVAPVTPPSSVTTAPVTTAPVTPPSSVTAAPVTPPSSVSKTRVLIKPRAPKQN